MCTSLTLPTPNGTNLFGRTLDLDTHFGEAPTLTPRRYPFSFADCYPLTHHYALLGMAAVADNAVARGYPLYAEAMNEKGLCMAGLRFAESAVYATRPQTGFLNLAPWELIPYLLGTCATVSEARQALEGIRVVDKPFSAAMGTAPLHWHMVDADPAHGGLIVEVTSEGMRLYEADAGVLANEPPYPAQLTAFRKATAADHLPAGYGSPARFARAATLRRWWLERGSTPAAEDGETPTADYAVAQLFSLLGAVSPTAGAVMTENGCCHRTLYTCCMDTAAGVYYYKTESHPSVRTVAFHGLDLNGERTVQVR